MPELNDKLGTVEGESQQNPGRWKVRMESGEAYDLKEKNLTVISKGSASG